MDTSHGNTTVNTQNLHQDVENFFMEGLGGGWLNDSWSALCVRPWKQADHTQLVTTAKAINRKHFTMGSFELHTFYTPHYNSSKILQDTFCTLATFSSCYFDEFVCFLWKAQPAFKPRSF